MYNIHKDYRKFKVKMDLNRFLIPQMQLFSKLSFYLVKTPATIKTREFKIKGYRDRNISLQLYSPKNASEKLPCLLFIHGGAFVLNANASHKKLICDYAQGMNCIVAFLDYSLAPKYPFPYALEDCYSGLCWLLENSQALGIDKSNIAVYGDSAGGALAAALTHMVRDRLSPIFKFQMLIYPVTDYRMTTDSMKKYFDTPLWNSSNNKKMWKLYVQQKLTNKDLGYASPLQNERFDLLPEAYIEVAEYDCLHDEGIEYYQKLKDNHISCVLIESKGTIHGFEINYKSKITQEIIQKRINYAIAHFNNLG